MIFPRMRTYFSWLSLSLFICFGASPLFAKYPLQFPPEKNGIIVPPPKFQFEVSDSSRLVLVEKLISFRALKLSLKFSQKEKGGYSFEFLWPSDLLNEGTLSIRSKDDSKLWSKDYTEENFTTSPQRDEKTQTPFEQARLQTAIISNSLIKDLINEKSFQFCLEYEEDDGFIKICSRTFHIRKIKGKLRIVLKKTKTPIKVFIDKSPSNKKGIILFSENPKPIHFRANLANGAFCELKTKPKKFEFTDIIYNPKDKEYHLTLVGAQPISQATQIKGDKKWKIDISSESPEFSIQGTARVPLMQELLTDYLPPEKKHRIYVNSLIPTESYSSKVILRGKKNKSLKLSAKKAKLKETSPSSFKWIVSRLPLGVKKRKYLSFKKGRNTHSAFLDFYRGYDSDITTLFSSVPHIESGVPSLQIFGELSMSTWFTKFLGMKGSLFYQKWGVEYKALSSLTTDQSKQSFSSHTLNFRYRFSSGLWQIDNSLGAIFSFQSAKPSSIEAANLLGTGLFWTRPFPDWMSRFVDWVSLFRYPKWMYIEFVYYPLPANDILLGTNYSILISGRMFFSPTFFLQVGGGARGADFLVNETGDFFSNQTTFANVGVGLNF